MAGEGRYIGFEWLESDDATVMVPQAVDGSLEDTYTRLMVSMQLGSFVAAGSKAFLDSLSTPASDEGMGSGQ